MPIEVYQGKAGNRLIPRLPVRDGSYARLDFTNRSPITVSYQGNSANGYPALSPTSLAEVSADLAQEVEVRQRTFEREFDEWRKYHAFDLEFTQAEIDERMRLFVPKCVFPRIIIGEPLQLVFDTPYRNLKRALGVIDHWEIFNR